MPDPSAPEPSVAATILAVDATERAAVERILRRSINADETEIRRLTMLGTAYADRPAGRDVDGELAAVRRSRDIAVRLLEAVTRS